MHFQIQDIYFIVILVATGIVAGYTGGLFGIGGGVTMVPVFITIFPFFDTAHSVLMHNAVGTSLALLIPNTLRAFHKQYKMGKIDWGLLKHWAPFVIIGSVLGAAVVKFIPTLYLKIIFAVYLYIACGFVALKKNVEKEGEGQPHGFFMSVAGVVIGCVSVFLGMGGGTFTVPYTQLYNYSLRRAIAISSATGVIIGVIGTVGVIISGWGVPGRSPYSLGFVNLIVFAIIVPFVLIFPPYGVKLANRISKQTLKRIYAIFLFVVAIYMTTQIFFTY